MERLLINIDKLHTTRLGEIRIKNNLDFNNDDIINRLKSLIIKEETIIKRKGKNYYVYIDNIEITINASNFCIITAHFKGETKND